MSQFCNILHVDDDDDIRVIVRLSLGLDDLMSVRSVGSGREAMELLRAPEEAWRPDLLLTDYKMPDMQGPALFGAVRALPGYATLPVIFLTARADVAARMELTRLGAKAVLVKPFDPTSLAETIRKLLSAPPRPD